MSDVVVIWANEVHKFYLEYVRYRSWQPDTMWALYTDADNDLPEVRELNRLKNQFYKAVKSVPKPSKEIRDALKEKANKQDAPKKSTPKKRKHRKSWKSIAYSGSDTDILIDESEGASG